MGTRCTGVPCPAKSWLDQRWGWRSWVLLLHSHMSYPEPHFGIHLWPAGTWGVESASLPISHGAGKCHSDRLRPSTLQVASSDLGDKVGKETSCSGGELSVPGSFSTLGWLRWVMHLRLHDDQLLSGIDLCDILGMELLSSCNGGSAPENSV